MKKLFCMLSLAAICYGATAAATPLTLKSDTTMKMKKKGKKMKMKKKMKDTTAKM